MWLNWGLGVDFSSNFGEDELICFSKTTLVFINLARTQMVLIMKITHDYCLV